MRRIKLITFLILTALLILTACGTDGGQVASAPTATLLPILSHTPRFTATPVASRTPLPTFTHTPSETPIPPTPTLTLTPSPTPPIVGIIQSLELVNIREGPGIDYAAIYALPPGTGLTVIGSNPDTTWFNVRFKDDDEIAEGWVSSRLVFIEDTPTPIPTFTPSPDLTALALGTPLPTVLLGGGTVTPTPPGSISTATQIGDVAPVPATSTSTSTPAPFIPVINVEPINATATALAGGIQLPTQPPVSPTSSVLSVTIPPETPSDEEPTSVVATQSADVTEIPLPTVNPATAGEPVLQENVRIFALCDDARLGFSAPTNLAEGSTIIVWWSWLAKTQDQIQQHLEHGNYEVRINDERLRNLSSYRSAPAKPANDWVVTWTVPFSKPLQAGVNRITYRVTWSQQISDGYKLFGPGSVTPVEEGSCTFNVR